MVLSDISFRLAAGKILLLRGPNGIGKSTLLRALAGLLPPASGSAELGGLTLARDPDDYAGHLAYAGHLDAIKPQLSVAENLAFWADLFGGGGIGAALEALDLGAIAQRPAHACSAGQKRRLGLARLVVADRPLWLLDEPTVSLDRAAVAGFCRVLRRHCAAGGMALVATHELDLEDARDLTLAAPAGGRETVSSDPFLAGNWA